MLLLSHQRKIMSKKVEELNIETPLNATVAEEPSHVEPVPGRYRVMRRNGKVTAYDPHKIVVALSLIHI